MMRIALLDDELVETNRLSQILTGSGLLVSAFNKPDLFLRALSRETFDLMIFDWQMPQMSGLEVLQWVRQGLHLETPVIFITNMGCEENIVLGLDSGATDYLIKPVRSAELLSRIRAAVRKTNLHSAKSNVEGVGPYRIVEDDSCVYLEGQQISLTPKEMALTLLLFRNLGTALSRSHIQLAVWGNELVSSRSMDAHLSRLRTKIRLNQEQTGIYLMPIYNFGYRLVERPIEPQFDL